MIPLVVIAIAVGAWAVTDAQARADDRFNRALLSAVLAISRDVAVSGGDALSPETNELLRDSFGGAVFYHVYAPDGVFVTGYATPPVPVTGTRIDRQGQQYFEGKHQNREVRAVRFVDAMQIDGLNGDFTVTVWQDRIHRDDLVRDLVRGTFQVILLLVATVAIVVWFGVRLGLRPLNDLEDAIAQRSSDELTPIQRKVPIEVTRVVRRLNQLFEQLNQSMNDQMDFISNAAHQLRNPIAGVLALAEAVHNAPTENEAKKRSADLLDAAGKAADLSQKLLLLERAKALVPTSAQAEFDLSKVIAELASDFQAHLPPHVDLQTSIEGDLTISGDETMIREAVSNLLDNAVQHGGSNLTTIQLNCRALGQEVCIDVIDDGLGLSPTEFDRARKRFEQVGPNTGSGLGVSIVDAVMRSHGGRLDLNSDGNGLHASMVFSRFGLPETR
ncbi:MAG: sensor histidine kinase [Pseudomonadota bacterium]